MTEAERFGWPFVFAGLLPDDFPPTEAVGAAPWGRMVEGADSAHPDGPGSSLDGREEHPVVHVSWNDRRATGERGVVPWGDELEPGGDHRMDVWQGDFRSPPRSSSRG